MAPGPTTNGYGGMYLPADGSTDPELARDEVRPELNNPSPHDVEILEQLYGTRKKMRIAVLGAGVSGLNFFKFAEQRLKNVEIICYEKNADVGGTWFENRYPGCACDIPSGRSCPLSTSCPHIPFLAGTFSCGKGGHLEHTD